MTKFARVIDMERCMGCRSCIAVCHVENNYSADAPWNVMIEHEVGEYPNVRTVFATMACMHCENPPCETICNEVGAHAISKNEFGVVLIDYDKCIGCEYCAAVCPYGAPQKTGTKRPLYGEDAESTPYELIPANDRHPTHRKQEGKVQKCTFCWHRLEPAIEQGQTEQIGVAPEFTPACDLVCPVNARIFGDLDDADSPVSRYLGTKKASQLKKEFGTAPQVYYVNEGGDF